MYRVNLPESPKEIKVTQVLLGLHRLSIYAVTTDAIVDSGASICVVPHDLARMTNLMINGRTVSVNFADGRSAKDIPVVVATFILPTFNDPITVEALPLRGAKEVLLGLNFLIKCRSVLDGRLFQLEPL